MKTDKILLSGLIALFVLFAIASNNAIFTIACIITITFYTTILISMFDIKLYKISYFIFEVKKAYKNLKGIN